MSYDKKKYEKLITESKLFELDKTREESAYRREAYKMIEYLYCYLMAVNEKEYEPYACEIMDVSTRCISNFDRTKGVFIHYFNASWKQEYSHLIGKQIIDNKMRGLAIKEEDKRNIQKYIKLVERIDTCYDKESLYHQISEVMDLPIEDIRLIAEMSNTHIDSDTIKNDDGEETSIWNLIPDGISIEKEFLSKNSADKLLEKINATFLTLQRRQRPIVSDMITAKIISEISINKLKIYDFINNEIIDEYVKTGYIPTQRDIADKYERNEASISRTIKEFNSKLKNCLKEDH